ncbi:MAG: hypothetical protein Q9184_005928 [Pyrenodesmia sp. 2 TL-2023]
MKAKGVTAEEQEPQGTLLKGASSYHFYVKHKTTVDEITNASTILRPPFFPTSPASRPNDFSSNYFSPHLIPLLLPLRRQEIQIHNRNVGSALEAAVPEVKALNPGDVPTVLVGDGLIIDYGGHCCEVEEGGGDAR